MKWQREVSIILVFTDEETKVQRDEISFLKSHSKLVAESGFESTSIYHWGSCSTPWLPRVLFYSWLPRCKTVIHGLHGK